MPGFYVPVGATNAPAPNEGFFISGIMSNRASNAREIPLNKTVALFIGEGSTADTKSAAISLSAWLTHGGKVQVEVSDKADFEAIANMMHGAAKIREGMTAKGRHVNEWHKDFKLGHYVFLNSVYGYQPAYFILFMPKPGL